MVILGGTEYNIGEKEYNFGGPIGNNPEETIAAIINYQKKKESINNTNIKISNTSNIKNKNNNHITASSITHPNNNIHNTAVNFDTKNNKKHTLINNNIQNTFMSNHNQNLLDTHQINIIPNNNNKILKDVTVTRPQIPYRNINNITEKKKRGNGCGGCCNIM